MAKKKKRRKRTKRRQIKIGLRTVAVLFALLCALIAWPYLSERKRPEKGAEIPSGSYSYGIDISRYQSRIQWDSLMVMTDRQGRTISSKTYAKDIKPVSYVFIKATEGITLKDRLFHRHWKDAGESGIRRGAYHFFRSSKDPLQQAEFFIRTVGPLAENDLPPVLDIETIHKGCSHKLLNEKALVWLSEIERYYGRKPIVYSSASFIDTILCNEIKENYPIWVAHYDVDQPRCRRWHIWQFSDKAIVHGINGMTDLNVCSRLTLDQL